jgi:hypothetical protein
MTLACKIKSRLMYNCRIVVECMQQHLSTASPAESKSLITIRPKGKKKALCGIRQIQKHAEAQQLQVEGAFEVYRLHGGTKCASHGHVIKCLLKRGNKQDAHTKRSMTRPCQATHNCVKHGNRPLLRRFLSHLGLHKPVLHLRNGCPGVALH